MLCVLLPALLAACSTLRLGYRQGPELAYWWLDGYADFDDLQAPQARQAIADWFRWHRQTQLLDYAALLDGIGARAAGPVTAAQVCDWTQTVVRRLEAGYEQAVPDAAALALRLGPAQVAAIERKQGDNVEDFREEWVEGTPEKRAATRLKRAGERLERFYGPLDASQRGQLGRWLEESPFDARRSLDERIARQRDVTATLRRLQLPGATQAEAEAALRELAQRVAQSPRPGYQAYAERLRAFNCELAARVHEITTPAQRERAAMRFAGWAQDLRSLVAP